MDNSLLDEFQSGDCHVKLDEGKSFPQGIMTTCRLCGIDKEGYGCLLAGPGRGDCHHYIGLPGPSISGQHDGPDNMVDAYGRPNRWCQVCWQEHKLSILQAKCKAMQFALEGIIQCEIVEDCPPCLQRCKDAIADIPPLCKNEAG